MYLVIRRVTDEFPTRWGDVVTKEQSLRSGQFRCQSPDDATVSLVAHHPRCVDRIGAAIGAILMGRKCYDTVVAFEKVALPYLQTTAGAS